MIKFEKANMSMLTMIIIGLIVVLIVVTMNNSLFQKTDDSVVNTFSLSNLQNLASNDEGNINSSDGQGVNSIDTGNNGEGNT